MCIVDMFLMNKHNEFVKLGCSGYPAQIM